MPLSIDRDADRSGWLTGVDAFNFHMHLPHYAVTDESGAGVLGQPIDLFQAASFHGGRKPGVQHVSWAPPAGKRASDILFVDLTVFSIAVQGGRKRGTLLAKHRHRAMTGRRTCLAAAMILLMVSAAEAATPVHGHYPPGQTGLRGAAAAAPGWFITDFNRLFSNLDVKDANGTSVSHAGEQRYANILMTGWTSETKILGMNYGALIGVPFATGNINPGLGDTTSSDFALGDIIVTPVSLYGASLPTLTTSCSSRSGPRRDGSSSKPNQSRLRLLVGDHSAGGVWYPGGDRQDWSVSAVARLEQNFEQPGTGITPGDNFDLDWGIGKVMRLGPYRFDAGVSGLTVR